MEKLDLNAYKNGDRKVITHEGVVAKISAEIVTVALTGNVHCEACNAKGACGVSEGNTKEIEVLNDGKYQLNEPVNVVLQKELGLKAVFWAYVLPFILVLSVLIIASSFLKEWVAGLLAMAILVPYYLMLYVLQNTFKKAFRVSIFKFN
ncbi:SoxR reducing system RseC family protein [Lutibacter sp. TH_r2]|uniref:SoxR reducing system RseC family protein n=1 Tax=Lutibacter sp. TH_r2 TaxID=3082083 RepID=UPI0029551E47|nr:SoxR reducing system RseC family protein [Lutibacter sp. TH_r2]MDV7187754.1 SoxR reducing system RseC family protein [Lutibacter sp. TH_r2]